MSSIHTRSQDKQFKRMVKSLFETLQFDTDELYNIPYLIDLIKYFYKRQTYVNKSSDQYPTFTIHFLQKKNRKHILDISKRDFLKQTEIIFVLCEKVKKNVPYLKTALFLLLTNFVLFYLNSAHLTKEEKNKISKPFIDKFNDIKKNRSLRFLEGTFDELSYFNVSEIGCPYLNTKEYPNSHYWLYMWNRAFNEC